ETHNLPDVAYASVGFGKRHGGVSRLAIGTKARLASGIHQRRMSAKPLRMAAAARVGPGPRRAVAAVDCRRLDRWPERAPGENGIFAAENLLGHGRLDVGPGDRAARRLGNAPGGAAIGSGEFLDCSDERQRGAFVTTD